MITLRRPNHLLGVDSVVRSNLHDPPRFRAADLFEESCVAFRLLLHPHSLFSSRSSSDAASLRDSNGLIRPKMIPRRVCASHRNERASSSAKNWNTSPMN